ncbi:MAG: hypothetical protein M1819_006111 [Sarea resinae]|nr:MAG: hypothetical protein M1819_006111 [Sarea resinae]
MDKENMQRYGDELLEDDRDRTLRALEGMRHGNVETDYGEEVGDPERQADRTKTGNEDLFLNLAKQGSGNQATEDALSRSERRRSRIALASHHTSLPQASQSSPVIRPSSSGAAFNDRHGGIPDGQIEGKDPWQPRNRRTSQLFQPGLHLRLPDRDRPYAASAHPLDDETPPPLHNAHRSSFSTPRNTASSEVSPTNTKFSQSRRRPSISSSTHTPNSGYGYRPSHLQYSTPNNYYSSPLVDRSTELSQVADGTESTISTTAPSTVWDELAEMKSRIEMLEQIKPSGERPRTATTTVTTMSSSPKRLRGNSVSPSELNVSPNIHPLLHSALAKTKSLVNAEVYRALEATASDALSLAAMMSVNGQGAMSSGASALSGATVSDRQIRRKADSMCRDLTELCIALSEGKAEANPVNGTEADPRPRSGDSPAIHNRVDAEPQELGYQHSRQTSDPTEPRSGPSRALTRLEARKSSLVGLNQSAISNNNSPRETNAPSTTPTQSAAPSLSRFNRFSSSLLRHRRPDAAEDTNNKNSINSNSSPSFRTPSRAATEVGGLVRSAPRERISRNFTNPRAIQSNEQQQQQQQQQQTPTSISSTPSSSLPLRRAQYASGASTPTASPSAGPKFPASSTIQPGNRRYLDRMSAAPSSIAENEVGGGGEREMTSRDVGRESRLPSAIGRARAGSLGAGVGNTSASSGGGLRTRLRGVSGMGAATHANA